VIQSQLRALEGLEIEEDGALRLQPCFSAVWDTALAVHILNATGTPSDDPRLLAAHVKTAAQRMRIVDPIGGIALNAVEEADGRLA